MKFTQFFTRLLAIVYICGLMVFANVNPAIAAQTNNNKIIDQLPLPTIQKKAEEITKSNPYDTNMEYTTQNPEAQGLNEIQGTADFDKMKRSPYEKTPPVVRDVEKVLDKAGDKMGSVKDDTQNAVDSAMNNAGDAANYVKDKAGDVVDSVTDKAGDAVKSIKNKVKS
jgi:ElaB/YqjD/DUF883 family membrane-anchored ribosome-binding protein